MSASLSLRLAKALARGELAIVPVDTEYQLVASARKLEAVESLFSRTGWTQHKPAPTLYFGHIEALGVWGLRLNEPARRLADTLWPGALELMVPRPNDYDGVLCGGRDHAIVRIAQHSFVHDVIKALGELEGRSAALVGIGLARAGGIPVTNFQHAAQALELPDTSAVLQSVAYVVDAGLCRYGLPATLVDATRNELKIRRLGPVTPDDLARAAAEPVGLALADDPQAPAHGQHPVLVMLDSDELASLRLVGRAWVIARHEAPADHSAKSQWIALPDNDVAYARELFAAIYRASGHGATTVYVQRPIESTLGQALSARLQAWTANSGRRDQKPFAS